MWPSEREDLVVWADELQARGERLGELIATSARAEALRFAGDEDEASAVERDAEDLRLTLARDLLGPAIDDLPALRLRWQLGVVRAIHLDWPSDDLQTPAPELTREVVVELLRRPALRFVDDLQLWLPAPDARFERDLLRALVDDESLACPRRIVLGQMPRCFRHFVGCPARETAAPLTPLPAELLEAACARGLSWFVRWSRVQPMPWARGDHGSRLQQLERLLVELDARTRPEARDVERCHALACAIWDSSMRVRRRALHALPGLPDHAAPAALAVLALYLDGWRSFGDIVERCLMRIASQRPSWVAGLAEDFSASEPWVAQWLSATSRRSRGAARRGVPRILGMIERLARGPRDYRGYHLERAIEHFPEAEAEASTPDGETVAELFLELDARRRR